MVTSTPTMSTPRWQPSNLPPAMVRARRSVPASSPGPGSTPTFRERLLADPVATISEYHPQTVPIAVLEDTPAVHHVIVCTLCSCYPSGLLGNPPAWYKSFEYRSRVVREPRAVLAEFGMDVGPDVELRVHDSTAEQRYLVLPLRPADTEDWAEEQLAGLVTRNSMVGTGRPRNP